MDSTRNATKLLESLSADEIRQRLAAIGREEQALRILLRAANRLGPNHQQESRSDAPIREGKR